MRELNTILATLNMSILDDEVIKRAILMAKETGAQLHFIHAVDISVIDIEITSKFLKQKIDEEGIKKQIVQKIDMLNGTLEYIVHIRVGDATEQVIHTAQKIRADLIILGSHSKTKIEDYYLGSTVNNIAQKSGLPILVIKNSVQGIYKNILAPTDFSSSSKKSVLFSQIAFKSSPIELVNVYDELDDMTIEFSQLNTELLGSPLVNIFKKEVGITRVEMIKNPSSINTSLLKYIKTKKSDLIVLGSRGSDIAGSFLGSTTAYLLRNSQSDVLIYIPLNQE